jgi:hypothetical protein
MACGMKGWRPVRTAALYKMLAGFVTSVDMPIWWKQTVQLVAVPHVVQSMAEENQNNGPPPSS